MKEDRKAEQQKRNQQVLKSPLCVFTLSPPFTVQEFVRSSVLRSASRRPSTPYWRRGDYSLPRIRPRFKPLKKTPSHALAKYLTGRIETRRRDSLSLQDVLNTIRYVWTSPNTLFKSSSSPKMEDRNNKKSTSDIPSPVLLRRRLSAPETIMRKHMLAQQRSESQDSDVTQTSDARSCQWRMETGIGSDPSLNKRRDHGLMRKSTLLRRLWGSNKPISERSSRLSSSYHDWHHGKLSLGRSTQSLGSNNSSPEHRKWKSRASLNGDEFKTTSPVHKKYEPLTGKVQKTQLRNPAEAKTNGNLLEVRSTGSYKTVCCSNCTYATSFENPTSSVNSRLTKTPTTTLTTTETESERYTTRSTRSTGTTTTTTTTFSDNSDSAYTNNNSNFTHTSNGNSSVCSTTYSSERFLEENGNAGETENVNEYRNASEKGEHTPGDPKTENFNDSSTQTMDTANLNVISNVQLSQSTLNMIFNQVMQDVQRSPAANINISTVSAGLPLKSNPSSAAPRPKLIQVQQVPSFYLQRKEANLNGQEQQRHVLKYMVGNVGTGSSYSKPQETPQVVVPRFSALPRTTSMEVNTSSGESTDKESDNVSLVDSLEDPSSPRVDVNQNKYDEKPVRGDLSPLLPDNSERTSRTESKASAFFVPIRTDDGEANLKSVADHLPEKVRERLSRRQMKREQKLKQSKIVSPKSDSNYVSASDNGNQLHYVIDNSKYLPPEGSKGKRRSKPLLPSIDAMRRTKSESKGNKFSDSDRPREKRASKPPKKRVAPKGQEVAVDNSAGDKRQHHWLPKSRHKVLERLYPLCSSKGEYVYDVIPKKIFHKTEVSNSSKRIEILEIVECMEAIPDSNPRRLLSKSRKSKIPVPTHPKFPSITKEKVRKPVFLDFDQVHENEPKIDQLIANILIDALNKTEIQGRCEELKSKSVGSPQMVEKRPPVIQPLTSRHSGNNKYQQTFEAIPEERTISLQSSSDDSCNGNRKSRPEENDSKGEVSGPKSPNGYKGKAAIDIVKDENLSTIPKGWITFYTLHKSQGSPESTSDEGKKLKVESENANYDGDEKGDPVIVNEEKCERIPDKNADARVINASETLRKSYSGQDIAPKYRPVRAMPPRDRNLSRNSLDSWTSSEQDQSIRVLHPLPPTSYVCRRQIQRKERQRPPEPSVVNKSADGWTVTVSGTTSGGQFAPDLEMRLTFPRSNRKNNPTSQSDSGLGEDNHKNGSDNFPCLISSKENNRIKSRIESSRGLQPLPQIGRHVPTRKARCESSNLIDTRNYAKPEPRQTRTSSRRLLLNRPRTFISPREFIDLNTTDSKLKEILEKFPEILTITGSTISPERKPRVPTMSERDVTRHLYRNT